MRRRCLLSGRAHARHVGPRGGTSYRAPRALVFVKAFERYAVAAFAHGALDDLVKPVEPERLADTVTRLQERLARRVPLADTDALIEPLAARLRMDAARATLRWIHAPVGQTIRMVLVDDIDFLRSDEKYTRIAWRGDGGARAEALIRTPLKELLTQLDDRQFPQLHRAIVVNLSAISHVTRGSNDSASIHLKGRDEVLPVSRAHLHRFRQI